MADETKDEAERPFDSKQKYTTVTEINHGRKGKDGNEILNVPAGVEFSKYQDEFTEDEQDAFVLQGTIAPLSDVNADISDENDALKAAVADKEAEVEDLNKKVADLEAALAAAQKPAVTPTGNNPANPPK